MKALHFFIGTDFAGCPGASPENLRRCLVAEFRGNKGYNGCDDGAPAIVLEISEHIQSKR